MLHISAQRINKEYIKEDCVQIQFNFNQGMSLSKVDTNEELLRIGPKENDYINTYLSDDRRKDFPYGNIPVHRELKYGEEAHTSVNQILEYDTNYVQKEYRVVWDGTNDVIREDKTYIRVIKDGDSAILLKYDTLSPEFKMDAEQIKNLETMKRLYIEKQDKPQILRIFNPSIPKEEIRKAKKLAKEKRTK